MTSHVLGDAKLNRKLGPEIDKIEKLFGVKLREVDAIVLSLGSSSCMYLFASSNEI